MKKLISLTIALFVLGLGTAFGQETADATISADVLGTLNITSLESLDFGQVSNQATHTEDAENGAKFRIDADSDSEVFIDIPATVELTGGAGGSIWLHTSNLGNDADDTATASEIDDNSTAQTVSGAGEFFVWVGGTLSGSSTDDTENIPQGVTGSKEGTLTVGVQYVSF
jgi:hypothetical protein